MIWLQIPKIKRQKINGYRALGKLSPYTVCIPLYPKVIYCVCVILFARMKQWQVIGSVFLDACSVFGFFCFFVLFFGSAWQIWAPWTNCRGRAPGISLTWPAFHKVRWLWSVSPCLMMWHFLGTNAVLSKQRAISLGILSQDLGHEVSKAWLENWMQFQCI